jgi:RNA polymerase sigma-70 factor (ECF subfamily)
MVYLGSGNFRRPLISKSLLRHPGDAELRGEPHELQLPWPVVLVVSLIEGGAGTIFDPAATAALPGIVPDGQQAGEQLDWPQIAALYGELADRTGSDVVRLNRAVAIAEAEGPAAALALVDSLDLPGYQYWHSTRAELLRRLGRAGEARAAYVCALELARTAPERRFLERRIAESAGF